MTGPSRYLMDPHPYKSTQNNALTLFYGNWLPAVIVFCFVMSTLHHVFSNLVTWHKVLNLKCTVIISPIPTSIKCNSLYEKEITKYIFIHKFINTNEVFNTSYIENSL